MYYYWPMQLQHMAPTTKQRLPTRYCRQQWSRYIVPAVRYSAYEIAWCISVSMSRAPAFAVIPLLLADTPRYCCRGKVEHPIKGAATRPLLIVVTSGFRKQTMASCPCLRDVVRFGRPTAPVKQYHCLCVVLNYHKVIYRGEVTKMNKQDEQTKKNCYRATRTVRSCETCAVDNKKTSPL